MMVAQSCPRSCAAQGSNFGRSCHEGTGFALTGGIRARSAKFLVQFCTTYLFYYIFEQIASKLAPEKRGSGANTQFSVQFPVQNSGSGAILVILPSQLLTHK